MQIFELHFNPNLKDNKIFDSFAYEPENIYERKLGGLYLVGEIRNALPKSSAFLNNLASFIKKNYYNLSAKSAEKALSQALKKANDFLAEEIKKNNVSWLGNLNFAALSIDNSKLSFSKTGDIKIILIRSGQINDISKNPNLQEIDPYPLKIFFNVISGKLAKGDVILVLTKKIFDFFNEKGIIEKIAQKSEKEIINEKNIKEILPSSLFNNKSNDLSYSGLCLLLNVEEIKKSSEKTNLFEVKEVIKKRINFQEKEKTFLEKSSIFLSSSFSKLRLGFRKIKKLKSNFSSEKIKEKKEKTIIPVREQTKDKNKVFKIKLSRLPSHFSQKINSLRKEKKYPALPVNKEDIKKINLTPIRKGEYSSATNPKKIIILLLALVFVLLIGFFIFQKSNINKKRTHERSFTEKINNELGEADNYLKEKNLDKANSTLKKAWQEILTAEKKENSFNKDNLFSLKEIIREKLNKVNNIEFISNPQKINKPISEMFSGSKLPPSLPSLPTGFNKNNISLATYFSNIYILNKKNCQVIKYPYLLNNKWGKAEEWTKEKGPCSKPRAMAIDSSIWIVNNDNSILRYYKGNYEKSLKLNIFPALKNITKIETGPEIPYLYLLEPSQERIIIIDKNGKIIKQIKSDKFDNLKDLAISEDGNIIYLLSGEDVFKVKI